MTLRVAFRVDASVEIGTGHMMRCLTLAQALRNEGARCHFIARDLPGNINDRVLAEGYAMTGLSAPEQGAQANSAPPPFAYWAQVSWQRDAEETTAALAEGTDWLIMDHYAFDIRWQRAVRPNGAWLMVLDDLADRPHACDLLLDQTLGRRTEEYNSLVPAHCRRLVGPRYALLRPQFTALRTPSLERHADGRLSRLLVLMGGMDSTNIVSDVLEGMRKIDLPDEALVTVVMGSRSPHLGTVQACAGRMPFATELRVDVTDMATLMAGTDLAISAGGLISYELVCMGVPSLLVPVSEIQEKVAREICRLAEARVVEDWRTDPAERIAVALRSYLTYLKATPPARRRIATEFDGLGAARVVEVMLKHAGTP